jgi:hypothetical protein
MSETSLSCSFASKAEVKKYMMLHQLTGYDAALRHMLARCQDQGQLPAPEAPSIHEAAVQVEEKAHQPLSFDFLKDDDVTMTYLTGLCKDSRDWLIPKLKTKVETVFLFLVFLE